MAVKVLYFSWIKEKVGAGEELLSPPDSVETVSDFVDWLRAQSPAHDSAFENLKQIRAAVDQVHVPLESRIGLAKEIAFFPPVTGG